MYDGGQGADELPESLDWPGFAGGAAVVLGGWFTASAVIAGHGWYHARLGHGVPWMPVAVAGFFGTLLALRRIPVVARALAAPGMVSRLELPHSFRAAEGTAFLATMALGHLPALFALPAGLGDIAAGIAAPLVAHRLAQGGGRRAALWFNAFGMTDLVVALTLGALTGYQLINVTPSGAPISELPLALIPTAGVPLLFALHITSVLTLARAPRTVLPGVGPRSSGSVRTLSRTLRTRHRRPRPPPDPRSQHRESRGAAFTRHSAERDPGVRRSRPRRRPAAGRTCG
jgi:hypothetical protein